MQLVTAASSPKTKTELVLPSAADHSFSHGELEPLSLFLPSLKWEQDKELFVVGRINSLKTAPSVPECDWLGEMPAHCGSIRKAKETSSFQLLMTARHFSREHFTLTVLLLLPRQHRATSVRRDKVDADKKDWLCWCCSLKAALHRYCLAARMRKNTKNERDVQECAWNVIPQSQLWVYLDDEYHHLSVFSASVKSRHFRNMLGREGRKWFKIDKKIWDERNETEK